MKALSLESGRRSDSILILIFILILIPFESSQMGPDGRLRLGQRLRVRTATRLKRLPVCGWLTLNFASGQLPLIHGITSTRFSSTNSFSNSKFVRLAASGFFGFTKTMRACRAAARGNASNTNRT